MYGYCLNQEPTSIARKNLDRTPRRGAHAAPPARARGAIRRAGKVGGGAELVERAGTTMHEVVTSVKRVTEIMGEISVASAEQSAGIAQVNLAIGEMDSMSQQNMALVEQATAAAQELQEQAGGLANVVGVFKLEQARRQTVGARPNASASTPVALRLAPG